MWTIESCVCSGHARTPYRAIRVPLGQRHPASKHVAQVPGVRVHTLLGDIMSSVCTREGRPKDKGMPPCETEAGACSARWLRAHVRNFVCACASCCTVTHDAHRVGGWVCGEGGRRREGGVVVVWNGVVWCGVAWCGGMEGMVWLGVWVCRLLCRQDFLRGPPALHHNRGLPVLWTVPPLDCFSPLPQISFFLLSLGVFSWNCGAVRGRGPPKMRAWTSLGSVCSTPRPFGPPPFQPFQLHPSGLHFFKFGSSGPRHPSRSPKKHTKTHRHTD